VKLARDDLVMRAGVLAMAAALLVMVGLPLWSLLAKGFEDRGTVRSFDNKYYSKSAATGPVSLGEPYHNDEFSFLKSAAKHDLKIPITGAYTLAVWSYDEHHLPKEGRLGGGLSRKDEVEARRKAVDQHLGAVRRHLDEAELRPKGLLAHEFGVHRHKRGSAKPRASFG